jgi:hypothetical protein
VLLRLLRFNSISNLVENLEVCVVEFGGENGSEKICDDGAYRWLWRIVREEEWWRKRLLEVVMVERESGYGGGK